MVMNTRLATYMFIVQFKRYFLWYRGGNVVVIDFGKLKVESELQPKNLSLEVRNSYSFSTKVCNIILSCRDCQYVQQSFHILQLFLMPGFS